VRFHRVRGLTAGGLLASLVFVGGCGENVASGEPAGHAPGAPAAAKSSAALPAVVLGQEDLDRVALTDKDVPGRKVNWAGAEPGATPVPRPPAVYKAAKPANCEAVSEAPGGAIGYRPVAGGVLRMVGSLEGDRGLLVSLNAYAPADAVRVISTLRTGTRACTTGFTAGVFHTRFDEVTPLPDPHLGDESVSFTMVQLEDGAPEEPMSFLAVRTGSAVVVFQAENNTGTGSPAVIPQDVVTAQLAKLRGSGG